MALSNAERQARWRQRLRDAAKPVAVTNNPHRRAVLELFEEYKEDNPDMTPFGAVLEMAAGEYHWREVVARVALDLFGLPTDPWPGLTYDALLTMIGKRTREAKRMGLPTFKRGPEELELLDKIRAAQHREWLNGTS